MTWEIGQTVEVQSRTWAGINKPGGCAKITKIHYAAADGSNIEALDVKYILGGSEKNIDPAIVSPYETLQRGGRKRRGREFLSDQVPDGISNPKGSVKEQERQKSVEQDEPPKPSPQSSPTTPTTPEQNNKKKQKATRVTPIPSIIIADRIMEVSPLPVDRSCKKQPQEQSLARRGLFEKDKGKASKDKKVITAKPPPQSDTKIAVGATASKYATTATPIRGATASTAPTQRTTFNPTMLNVAKRPTPLSAEKPILQLPRPKTKSPHTDNKNVKSVPLRRVFENEKRRAREFIDDICRPRNNDIIPDPSKENTTLSTSTLDRKKPPVSPSRLQQFLSIFRSIRLTIDDGTIEESEFHKLINSQASKPFSQQEVGKYVESLSEEGKLMKSEGCIYIID